MLMMTQFLQSEFSPALFASRNSSFFFSSNINRNTTSSVPIQTRSTTAPLPSTVRRANHRHHRLHVKASLSHLTNVKDYKAHPVRVTAEVSVKLCLGGGGLFPNFSDTIADLRGRSIVLELVSAKTMDGTEGLKVKGYAHWKCRWLDEVKYECSYTLPANFGELGAVLVENEHHKPMYLHNIVVTNLSNTPITITCNSWVQSKFDIPDNSMRIFFPNKCYLPSNTPSGIQKLREQELTNLRGDGTGERKEFDRIYDYDKYNDLGNPDKNFKLARPVLGGRERPYPRRCRTGRPQTDQDPLSEKLPVDKNYVPKDEDFSTVKRLTFKSNAITTAVHALLPIVEAYLLDNEDLDFTSFSSIDSLFKEGIPIPNNQEIQFILPRLIKLLEKTEQCVLRFDSPELLNRDKFSWFRDEEFSRQTLAGLNPLSIQLVAEWPMMSKLVPEEDYGSPVSAITKEIVEREINGIMTLEQAMEKKKLFVIDYHDVLLPYVPKVRKLEGTTLYGSRTLFFLCDDGTLKPIAIELTRPPMDDEPEWKHVFTPSSDATNAWLWKLAKTHVVAHDSGYHQLVSHWLRTHCCMEPYIIAANRQLSAMHPIYKLLHPHFRYTMEINGSARQSLINAADEGLTNTGGIIEKCFSPGKHSMELSSDAYDLLWRFDMEALPADLIRRGMAVEDPAAEHGLRLTIEDYPYANDGLILWDAIKSWVTDYVNYYYRKDETVETDTELQAWWTEVRTVGHGDKKEEPWWPVLNTKDSLIQTLCTIIWVASGHHAAVNFGQYAYAAYFPNRPSIARTNVPIEDPNETDIMDFITKPEKSLLECFPSQVQAIKVMVVLHVLSDHSPDEEYIGGQMEAAWSENPVIKGAFERFVGKLQLMKATITERNANPKFVNRVGAGLIPYELLMPTSSKSGVTGMGVPNSVSI